MAEYISNHRLVFGGKGDRTVIEANKRFESEDYADQLSDAEIARLLSEGAIRTPNDPAYAQPRVGEGQATATMGRSPRTDTNDEDAELRRRVMGTGADQPAEGGEPAPAATGDQAGSGRRGRAARAKADDDDDDDTL